MRNPLQASDNYAEGYSVVKAHSRREGIINRQGKDRTSIRGCIFVLNWSYWKGAGQRSWGEKRGRQRSCGGEGMAEELGGGKGKRWQMI